MRSKFDSMLEKLHESLIELGQIMEKAISLTTASLVNKDMDAALQAIELESEINQREKDIEGLCFKLMLQQQPVARDLRMIQAALKMITDMERIGDHARDISEICLLIGKEEYIKAPTQFAKMGETAVGMIRDVINAFVQKNRELALDVISRDDVIDNLFVNIKDDLYELMLADASNGRQALDFLMIAKYYERIGDHTENIAEWVIFSITGEAKESIHQA